MCNRTQNILNTLEKLQELRLKDQVFQHFASSKIGRTDLDIIESTITPIDIQSHNFADDAKNTVYFYAPKPDASFDTGGNYDNRSRKFCVDMIKLGKYYTKDEINQLSFSRANKGYKNNYSIFKYAGGHNCRHQWNKVEYTTPEPPKSNIRKTPIIRVKKPNA